MLFGKFVAPILSVLPLLFLLARSFAKRSRLLPWTIDDTLLVLALLLLYVVVAMFLVSMAASLVRQHLVTATKVDLKRTLIILWLFRLPMAISIALTRCAILIFFIRTLYTKIYSLLRHGAHFCIIMAIALGLANVLVVALHCRPLKYNYTIPFENPRHCFRLKPCVVCIAILGVVLDALIWSIPHYVVWHLQLRLSHKLAISVIFTFGLFNIFIGSFRVNSLVHGAFQGDVTYGMGTTFMWAIAQISTGIMVACCPHLRPLFECILPHRLTHISTYKPKSAPKTSHVSSNIQMVLMPPTDQSRSGSITVTTDIAVERSEHLPPPTPTVSIHDGQVDTEAPTFDVERGPATRLRPVAYCCGESSRGCGCLC